MQHRRDSHTHSPRAHERDTEAHAPIVGGRCGEWARAEWGAGWSPVRSAWEAEEGEEGGRKKPTGGRKIYRWKDAEGAVEKRREGSGDEAVADKEKNDGCTASLNGQLPHWGWLLTADRFPDTLSIPPGFTWMDGCVEKTEQWFSLSGLGQHGNAEKVPFCTDSQIPANQLSGLVQKSNLITDYSLFLRMDYFQF